MTLDELQALNDIFKGNPDLVRPPGMTPQEYTLLNIKAQKFNKVSRSIMSEFIALARSAVRMKKTVPTMHFVGSVEAFEKKLSEL